MDLDQRLLFTRFQVYILKFSFLEKEEEVTCRLVEDRRF